MATLVVLVELVDGALHVEKHLQHADKQSSGTQQSDVAETLT